MAFPTEEDHPWVYDADDASEIAMICIEDCYHVTPIEYAAQVDNGAQSLEIVELLHTFASRPLTRRNPESHLTLLHWAARGDTEAQCPGERPFAATARAAHFHSPHI